MDDIFNYLVDNYSNKPFSFEELSDDKDICSICQDVITENSYNECRLVKCQHKFHSECLRYWFLNIKISS